MFALYAQTFMHGSKILFNQFEVFRSMTPDPTFRVVQKFGEMVLITLNPRQLIRFFLLFSSQGTGISEEVFRQIETVQNRYDSSTAAAFRAVQKSGEMVVRTLDPRQFIRLASETAPKINIDTNVSQGVLHTWRPLFRDFLPIGK